MQTSLFLGKVIGPVLVIVSAGALLNRRHFEKIVEDMANTPVELFFFGLVALILGCLLVRVHNVWTADWRLLVTLVGWSLVLRGLWASLAPRSMAAFVMRFMERRRLVTAALLANVLLGGVMTYAAYVNG